MIDLVFQKGTDNVAIRIKGRELTFAVLSGIHGRYSSIDGLRLSVGGILQEYPDLEDKEDEEIKKIGLERFKQLIKSMKSENEIVMYLKNDLKKHGYVLKIIKKEGFRPIKVKEQ